MQERRARGHDVDVEQQHGNLEDQVEKVAPCRNVFEAVARPNEEVEHVQRHKHRVQDDRDDVARVAAAHEGKVDERGEVIPQVHGEECVEDGLSNALAPVTTDERQPPATCRPSQSMPTSAWVQTRTT